MRGWCLVKELLPEEDDGRRCTLPCPQLRYQLLSGVSTFPYLWVAQAPPRPRPPLPPLRLFIIPTVYGDERHVIIIKYTQEAASG